LTRTRAANFGWTTWNRRTRDNRFSRPSARSSFPPIPSRSGRSRRTLTLA
jgi:hypothetical protein